MAKRESVRIGGKKVSVLRAALMAQEADRLGVLVGKVEDLVLPRSAPATVRIAGITVSIAAGATLARVADEEALHPKKLIEQIVHEHAQALGRRARRRGTTRRPEGAWMRPASSGRGGGA